MLKTDMRYRLKASVLAVALAALPLAASAAGLGRITVFSALGQPLKAELEVSATRDEAQSLVAKVASVDAFHQAGVEYVPALAALRFSRDIKERDGRRYIQITTDRPLNEPFIDMLVELNWSSGRLVREYTFLLDPPDLVPATAPTPMIAPEVKAVTKVEAVTAQPAEKLPVTPALKAPPAGDARPAVPKPGPDTKTVSTPAKKTAEKIPSSAVVSHKVVAGDTLTKIASKTKPEGVSLDQMLVTLFRSNKEAFAGNNMNRLIAGKILAIPDAQEAGKVTAGEAHQEIVAQSADFNVYRKKLATAVAVEPAKEETTKQVVSGKIFPKVEDKAVPATNVKDKLEVSRTEVAKNSKDGKALQSRIATLEEDLVARDRALQEANSRAADLEKSLSGMKKLAELKNQSGVALQQQAQAAKPVPSTPVPAPLVKAPEPAQSLPTVAEAAKPVDVVKSAEAPQPTEVAKPAAPVQSVPAPRKRPLPPPEPEPEPGFLEENGLLVFGGGGVVALLLGWLGFSASRRKRKAAAEAETGNVTGDFPAHSVFSTPSVAPPPGEQEPSQFSVTTSGIAASASESIDAISEADTFLAFGREAQAEEVLLAALEKEPERHPLYLKLFEIYAGRRSRAQFESLAKRFHAQTEGIGPDWERAATLGAEIDPENVLYRPVAAVVEETAVTGMDAAIAAGLVAAASSEVVKLSGQEGESTPVGHQDAVADAAAIDFDLDLDASNAGVPAVNPEATQILSSASEMTMLDFDLELSPPAAATTEPASPVPLDLDLPLGDEAVAVTAAVNTAAAAGTATSMGGIDFDFDLELPDATPESSGDAVDGGSHDLAAPAVAALDLASISLELEPSAAVSLAPSPAESPIPLELPTLFVPAVAAPSADERMADLVDNSEVATKLELATAYEEMGDKEGARELYQEALMEGSSAQQDIARAKLASLA